MGFVIVSPHKTPDDLLVDRRGKRFYVAPLGPMKDVRPKGGMVRVGYVDVLGGPVRFRSVPLAPVFDPLADSMGPWCKDAPPFALAA